MFPVMRIGIVLMQIRIRISMLMGDGYPDPDLDPDWRQYDADPLADPTPSFTNVGKIFYEVLFSLMPVHNIFPFSSLVQVS